jgi:hypothetical protein
MALFSIAKPLRGLALPALLVSTVATNLQALCWRCNANKGARDDTDFRAGDEVPPGVPSVGCHETLGHTLLYVGIGPKETKGETTKPSVRTLRHRMRDHYGGNGEGSTLRLTLGCLLSDSLNIKLRRVGSGKRRTFTNPGEILDKWMAMHARVAWAAVEEPWMVEKRLLATTSLPLNLQGNAHPFVPTLKGIRRAAKQAAQALPVVADSGGPRKVPAF